MTAIRVDVGGRPVLMSPQGATGAWLRAHWWSTSAAEPSASWLARASKSFWLEWHREVRRHAGDERLPLALRARLRESAHRSLARSATAAPIGERFPRRLLRERVHASLPPALITEASNAAAAAGITSDRPIVAVEHCRRPDKCTEAVAWLERQGYRVIDPSSAAQGTPLVGLFLLRVARFLVCESADLQHTAYLTDTPSLLLNALDPFSGYPVRGDSLFTLKTAINLDSGQTLGPRALIEESYLRDRANFGYRGNDGVEVLAAVQEMHEGLTQGWRESEAQTEFRDLVTKAGTTLAARVPHVALWGPDEGFLGDGRLARCQADRAR